MEQDVYRKLQEKLDDLGPGFPKSQKGLDIKILKQIFTPEEADMFTLMSPILTAAEDVAAFFSLDAENTATLLETMATKGQLFRLNRGGKPKYAVVPFVVGVFEFQLNNLTKELSADLDGYYEEVFGKEIQAHGTPILRTIPIDKSIVAKWPVAPYEDVVKILEDQKKIAVAPCICRTMAEVNERDCGKPKETCFLFGAHAEYYVDNKMGRFIELDEAKAIVEKGVESGLVMQPFNSQKIGGMCSCCGCCCGVLRSLKMQPSPVEAVKSNYFAEVDEDLCTGCEVCLDRCQMEAITIDDIATIDLNRCIGCGLCVPTCPTEAMGLMKKSEEDIYTPPTEGAQTYLNIMEARGKSFF